MYTRQNLIYAWLSGAFMGFAMTTLVFKVILA